MQVHVPLLRELARGRGVLELGVRYGVSTAAFLAGRPKFMVSVDAQPFVYQESYQAAADEVHVDWRFYQQDECLALRPFDLIFFDTTHTYAHLSKELAQHVKPATKFLVFHDTVLFWEHDDCGMPGSQATLRDCGRGIGGAITEFRARNPEWKVYYKSEYLPHVDGQPGVALTFQDHYARGCGLLVLKRG
jgi:hypothetical protein